MNKKLFLVLAFFTLSLNAQTPCDNGMAGQYPCDGLDLISQISLNEMNANVGNDSWGWTDPDTGKEYAIVGLDNGTAFIDISDPINPIFIGKVQTTTGSSTWRDVKTYDNHAFIVSDFNGNHGMQVFDLTRLRNVSNPPEIFTVDALFNEVGSCHNIVINEETGFAYAVGCDTFAGGPHFIDISDPKNPQTAGGYADVGYSHDAQVVTYNGPDSDYVGREIYIGSNEDEVTILDVTDKNDVQFISLLDYSNVAYTHQGWFTEDMTYFILGDERDELDFGFNTRTLIFDFTDLDNPQLSFEYLGPTPAIDHNGYVKGDKFYLSNYTAGLRVLDISDIANQNIEEVMSFDSYPSSNGASFDGVWSNYPYFESGNIVLSDMNSGFLLVKDPTLSTQDFATSGFSVSPNPASDVVSVASSNEKIKSLTIYNVLGQMVKEHSFEGTSNSESISVNNLKSGMYLLTINQTTTKRLIVK